MASCIFIVPHARLHMRPLQECLANQWTQARGQLTDLVLVTSRAYDSLHWWTPHNLCKGRLFQEPVPQIILTTDASLQGWGAHVLTYTVQGLSVQQSRASPDGQHDRDVLHSKAGRHPLATAVSSGSEHVEVGHSEEHFPHGRTPPRKGQSDGGSAQQIQPSNARVGDTPVCSPPVLPAVGSSGDRPVCHSRERKMPTLCRQVPSPTVAGECDMDELVRQICVRFSASPSNTAGRKKAKAARDDSHPGCSNVGAPSLVHHVPRTLSGAASKAAPHAQSFDAEPWRHSASRSTTAQPGDLAPEVLEFGYLNLPPECMHIIKEARKPTTRACYAAKWKRFVIYCTANDIDPLDASIPNIICYLLHLYKCNLAYTSIRIHLSAIAAYLQNRQHLSVFRVPAIKAFLEGLKRVIPPRTPPAPVWNLNVVLTRLMGPPFEPLHSCELQFLTWKVAFLVAITSLRRVSELQALTIQEPFIQIHSNRVVLRTNPKFLPKVVSQFHLNQTIDLPAFFQNPQTVAERMLHTLDVRRALMYYIDRTQPFRKTKQLFVAFAPQHKGNPISKAGIARWIVKCIQICYQKAKRTLTIPPRAHSTRKLGASMAFLGNIPLEDICRAATWVTPHTFTKHYCVDVHSKQQAAVGQAVLKTLFQVSAAGTGNRR
ncbi:uncharacterized protein LOC144781723 [Lissotriton helveticus]